MATKRKHPKGLMGTGELQMLHTKRIIYCPECQKVNYLESVCSGCGLELTKRTDYGFGMKVYPRGRLQKRRG